MSSRSRRRKRVAKHAEGLLANDLMLKYAISEDCRLHSEKFTEPSPRNTPAFRWRNITALARVTASAYGYSVDDEKVFQADGYEETCRLLGVDT